MSQRNLYRSIGLYELIGEIFSLYLSWQLIIQQPELLDHSGSQFLFLGFVGLFLLYCISDILLYLQKQIGITLSIITQLVQTVMMQIAGFKF